MTHRTLSPSIDSHPLACTLTSSAFDAPCDDLGGLAARCRTTRDQPAEVLGHRPRALGILQVLEVGADGEGGRLERAEGERRCHTEVAQRTGARAGSRPRAQRENLAAGPRNTEG